MKVRVNYFGQLRQITNLEAEEVDVPANADLASFLSTLGKGRDDRFLKILLTPAGAPSASVMVLANNEPIARTGPLRLRDGDSLSLIPAISGG